METREGLKLVSPGTLHRGPLPDAQHPNGPMVGVQAVSPDAVAIAYRQPLPANGKQPSGTPCMFVESVAGGVRPIFLEGQGVRFCGISAGAQIVIASTVSFVQRGGKNLLALDLRSDIVVHDFTSSAAPFEISEISRLETISVAGSGTLAALGSSEHMQVLEIPGGKTVYAGPGRFPKLSPDGTRLAFIDEERLTVRSLVDGSSKVYLPGTRVMGAGGWSPDGRYLAAGAWTTRVALEKRQIVVDMLSGDYAVVGKLGEGDYGYQFAWVSVKLLSR
jgi:hypothetical protein